MDDFVKHRSDRLLAIAEDVNLSKLAHRVATLVILRYLNRTSGYAWAGTRRLAEELKADRRNVQHALHELVERGHFVRTKRGGGREHSNNYRLGTVAKVASSDKRRDSNAVYTPKRREGHPLNGVTVTPEPRNLTWEDDDQRATRATPTDFASHPSPGKQPRQTNFPVDWKLGAQEAKVAQRIRGWDRNGTEAEFEQFRTWAQNEGARSPRWPQKWEEWCENNYSRRPPAGQEKTSSSSRRAFGKRKREPGFVQGLQASYNKQTKQAGYVLGEKRKEGGE